MKPEVPAQDARASGAEFRVLQVVTARTFAGIERHVLNLSRELVRLGCEVEIACPPAALRLRQKASAAGIPVQPPPGSPQRVWPLALARKVATCPPDVVHVHDGRAAMLGPLLARLAGARLVRTQHFTRPASSHRAGGRGRASLAVHRFVNARLDGYVAVSRAVEREATARREIEESVAVIISPAIVLPGNDVVSVARETRGDLTHPVVVFAGRLERERRLDVLIGAIPIVLTEIPDCRFVLAGSGAVEGELRQLAAQAGVASSITWTGWLDDPYDAFGQAHVYVNTWPGEAFGMAMAEAMALELPVVAVDAGANGEMVEDGVTGFLVPEDDPPALACAIVRATSGFERAAAMGRAARQQAVARYGAGKTAERTMAHYRQVRDRTAA